MERFYESVLAHLTILVLVVSTCFVFIWTLKAFS
jgi:hypothetical protein